MPLPGPQRSAYESQADVLLYGGAAGGGKTDLLLGLALGRHRRSILFRREFAQLKAIEDRTREMMGPRARYSATRRTWQFAGGRSLELGAVQRPGDERKYQGRPHDLKAFDEIINLAGLTAADVGKYLVPCAAADGTISATAVTKGDLTLGQYIDSFGSIEAIGADGRPLVNVKNG